ncbi:MAG TPA: ABC transporter permease [Candidatus Merdivicinus faecavium]|nr:ABC transporter permease [Candidatus Merdivicinus faecavium]
MAKYLLKRFLYMIFVFFIVSILMFAITKLVPGDPALKMVNQQLASTDPARYQIALEEARESLGLDQPLPIQYVKWMGNILTGNFGFSIQYKKPVIEVVGTPMLNTVALNLCSLILVFAITIPLGIISAVKKRSAFDQAVQVGSIIGYSLPTFVIALVFIYLFSLKLQLFPISGSATPGADYTGLRAFGDYMYHMALPLIVSTFCSLGGILRYVRAAMIDALREDYIRTARAKGLREKVVIYSHAFRNALIPIVTIITSWFVSIFGGSVVIESIFLWNGLGNTILSALRNLDSALYLAMMMFYVVITLLGNLLMDIAYCIADPRVKLQ